MAWELDDRKPIYPQLMDEITRRIIKGEYPPGEKLPSVRELAEEATVNPNTMQKAFTELERMELVKAQRGAGRTVTEDAERVRTMRTEMATEEIGHCIHALSELGYEKKEMKKMIEDHLESEEERKKTWKK